MIRAVGKIVLSLGLLLALLTGSARAASLQPIGSGFVAPVYLTSDPSDPERLFVVERGGTIQLLENGELKPFANLAPVVVPEGEGGLLSIAMAPDFHTSGRLFVYYTGKETALEAATSPPDIHVAELRASGSSASLSTLRNLVTIPHPDHTNHYGGQLQVGPEGNLFVSTGDGGGGDPEENAQDLGSPLGKILRLDPDPSSGLPYTVPDNPFVGTAGADPLIWSYGLRNPFRFSFDRLSGDIWIGDVGQDSREEVDFGAAPGPGRGANYGWNCREGSLEETVPPEPGCASAGGFVDPVFEYANATGFGNCAVIGGYVARGPGLADLYGRYVYGDLCVGELRSFSPAAPSATDRGEGLRVEGLNSFGEDACGRLYTVSGEGSVSRLVGPGGPACPVAAPAPTPLSPSVVGIRALRRKVIRNRRALITAWVAPCKGRQGEPVTLWRGRKKIGTRRLDRVCTARFRPRISRRSGFRATVKASETYVAAISRKLTVKPRPKPKKNRRR